MKNNYTMTALEDILRVAEDVGYTSDFTKEELEEAFSEENQYKEPLFKFTVASEQSGKE